MAPSDQAEGGADELTPPLKVSPPLLDSLVILENIEDECTFSSCANIKDGTQTIISKTGEISVVIEFEGHSTVCNCDVKSWICSEQQKNPTQIPIVAAGRIMLKKQGPFNKGSQFFRSLSL